MKSSSITSMLFFRLRMFVNVIIRVRKTSMKRQRRYGYGKDTPELDFDEGQFNSRLFIRLVLIRRPVVSYHTYYY